MAFRKNGWKLWAAGLLAACAARTTDAQVYNSPPSAPPAQYSRQPAMNPGIAPQPGAAQGYQAPQYQAAPGQYQAPQPAAQNPFANQSPRFQSPQGTAQPQAAPVYTSQPGTLPQYTNQNAPAAMPQNAAPQYGNQPRGYAAQPARQPMPAPSAPQNRFAPAAQQPAPVASYPAAARMPGNNTYNVRPAQFEQPIEQQPAGGKPADAAAPSDPPGFRASEVSTGSAVPSTVPGAVAAEATPQEHPLMPALRWAKQGLTDFSKIQDYSCTLVKRERIDGTLNEHEYMFVKVRHQPFSVYTYFLGPARVKGQEAIYVDGANEGSLLAHGNGIKHRLIGTVSLKPTSTLAMSGNRYPITEMGMRRLLERLLEIGSNDVKYGECTVNWIQGAKVNNRICTCIQVVHPVPRRNFLFHLARIYVDDELQLPIRYEAYDWPAPGTSQPQLTEEYTFLNVKVNNGFTDADFSTDNPSYGFK